MNGTLVNEEALHLAARVTREAGHDRAAQIRRLFEIVYNRLPEAQESTRMFATKMPLEAICRILLSSNEMLYTE
jgi:hypothetical protein